MTRPIAWLKALAVVGWLARPALAQDSIVRMARVTYVTSTSAYIDAGREAGLREGMLVHAVRGGAVIGVLKVSFLASRQASCELVSETAAIVAGDSVRFTVGAPRRDSTLAARPTAGTRSPSSPARPAWRGRIAAHYLVVGQDGGGGFSQPSLDLRMDGTPFRGSPLALTVDVRARRTASSLAAGGTTTDGSARAYQLALSWNRPGSPARITVGRQFARGLPAVGTFDGVLIELSRPGWSVGVFTGSQPEPLHLGFATDILQGGGFVQRRSRPGTARQWSVTLGASGSYENAHANREFAFVHASFSDRRLAAAVSQEIDYYRWWKRTPGTASVSPTSTFATLRYRASEAVTFNAGFDNRRNVLLYRDVVNPVTSFDDTFRQGMWAGVGLQFARRYRVGLDARRSSGGLAGQASSYTMTLGAQRLAALGLGLRLRSTYYENRQLDGWLHAGSLGVDPGERVHLELSGGVRMERDVLADPATRSITWLGADVDVNLARAWYVMASASRERGAAESSSLVYAGLSMRF